ncbi:MAG: restriction endonuclease subunit S [Firmicutes bacterium]|nr:restriction endonuclease subunit S [Bacillota bacterium]
MKQYPVYKDSGIDWIGKIPKVWDIKPVRAFCNLGRGRVISHEEIASNQGEYPVFSSQTSDKGIMGKLNTYDFNGEYVTWTTDGANAGTVFYRTGKFNCTNVCGTLSAKDKKVYMKYLPYALNILTKYHVRYDINPKLMNNEMAAIKIPAPTYEEQKVIADYLDEKTSQIDELINKKEKMIDLLHEQRTAIINHAVTKGINPDVKMKDSGIEWLGKIPQHWEVLKIKRIVSIPITDGPHETPKFLSDGIPFISAEAIKNERIDFSKKRGFISIEEHKRFSRKYKPQTGDIYMVKSGATTGNMAKVETDEEFNIWSPLAVIRPDHRKAFTEYVFYFMKSKSFFRSVEIAWSFGTQQNIGMGAIENLLITIPPKNEQKTIINHLDIKIIGIDKLISKQKNIVNYLKEYKTTLISEVVTGKIDVRN